MVIFLFDQVAPTRQDRSCLIHAQPEKRAGEYSLGSLRLVHNILLDYADARAARAACPLRHDTMTSNYYIIIPVRELTLS